MSDSIAWMVEVTIKGQPAWWSGHNGVSFSTDPNSGIRFKREQDAKFIIDNIIDISLRIQCRATDHMWFDSKNP